jgi:hypothetical protein
VGGEIWITNKFVGLAGSLLELVPPSPQPKMGIEVVCLGSLLELLLVFGEDLIVPGLTVALHYSGVFLRYSTLAPRCSTEGVLCAIVLAESEVETEP